MYYPHIMPKTRTFAHLFKTAYFSLENNRGKEGLDFVDRTYLKIANEYS